MAKQKKSNLIRWIALALILCAIVVFMVLDSKGDRGMQIVAKVDNSPIYLFELERELKNYYDQIGGNQRITDDNLDDLRVSTMNVLIEQEIVLLAAKKANYKPSFDEVDAYIEEQKQQAGSQLAWEAFLSSWGFTEATFREYLAEMYTVDNYPPTAWGATVVTDEQVRTEFEDRLAKNPSLKFEEAESLIRTTLEVDAELQASQAWFNALKDASKIEIMDRRVKARNLIEEEKYEEAIKEYLRARKSEPEDPYIDVSIAKTYSKMGDAKNMEKYFESALKKDSKNTFIYLAKAKLLIDAGDTESAKAQMKLAVEHADETNLPLLERLEEVTMQLDMVEESDLLDRMIREIMMPSSTTTTTPQL